MQRTSNGFVKRFQLPDRVKRWKFGSDISVGERKGSSLFVGLAIGLALWTQFLTTTNYS